MPVWIPIAFCLSRSASRRGLRPEPLPRAALPSGEGDWSTESSPPSGAALPVAELCLMAPLGDGGIPGIVSVGRVKTSCRSDWGISSSPP